MLKKKNEIGSAGRNVSRFLKICLVSFSPLYKEGQNIRVWVFGTEELEEVQNLRNRFLKIISYVICMCMHVYRDCVSCRTPFTYMDRYNYVDPDYALTDEEILTRRSHRSYYVEHLHLIQDLKKERRRKRYITCQFCK